MRKYLYNFLIRLILPLLFVRLWLKGKKSADYRERWLERLGYFNAPHEYRNGICFHCVSVGEAIAAGPLIKQIQQQYPCLAITVTTTTPTGSEQVKAILGDSVFQVYLPFDTPGSVKRFLRQLQPRLIILVETELWPNLLHFSHQFSVKTLLANARLSVKSAAGYHKLAPISRQMMDKITHIAAHNLQDAKRFIELGLLQEKLSVTGSIKFDIHIDKHLQQQTQALKAAWLPKINGIHRPVWVAGSTHPGEEELILEVYRRIQNIHPNLLLVLVPRHQNRFDSVAKLIEKQGFEFVRRSALSLHPETESARPSSTLASSNLSSSTPPVGMAPEVNAHTQIVLGDTMGELLLFWSIANIAFVGGSLVDNGGHNPLEPSLFNIPVISGTHVRNFKHIYQSLAERNGVVMVSDIEQLTEAVLKLLCEQSFCQQLGSNAAQVLNENRGAMVKLNQQISQLLVA